MSFIFLVGIIFAFFWVKNNWNNVPLFQTHHPKQGLLATASADSTGNSAVLSFADEHGQELISLSVIELCSHMMVMGASGSGKTSTILKITLENLMQLNLPGVIFAAKIDDIELVRKLADNAGRALTLIDKSEGSARINFIQALLGLSDDTGSIVEVLFRLPQLLNKSLGSNPGEIFWQSSGRLLLKACLDLIYLTGYPVTIDAITSVLTDLPRTEEDLIDPTFLKKSLTAQLLLIAEAGEGTKTLTRDQQHNLKTACNYFKEQYLAVPEVTMGSVQAVLDSTLFYLRDGMIRRVFCTDSTISFNEIFIEGGRTIFVNFPVALGQQMEKFASGLFRETLKQAILARDKRKYSSYCYLYMDEYQTLALETDAEFFGTCRSQKVINLIATQSYDSMVSSLGSGEAGRQRANIILGNCAIHCYLKSQYETAKIMADSLGREYKTLINTSHSTNSSTSNQSGDGRSSASSSDGKNSGYSTSTQRDYIIFPEEIMRLKAGGFANNYQVEMYLMPGKVIAATQTNFLKITLDQDLD